MYVESIIIFCQVGSSARLFFDLFASFVSLTRPTTREVTNAVLAVPGTRVANFDDDDSSSTR